MAADQKETLFDVLAPWVLVATILAAVIVALVGIWGQGTPMDRLKLATGYALLTFLFFVSITILFLIVRNKINLSELLEEMSGGASMSRFQLLVFTLVIAFSLFLIVLNKGTFPDIPGNVIILLGVSAGTYGVSKGLQVASGDTGGSDAKAKTPTEPNPK
jgi:hypothetical protein